MTHRTSLGSRESGSCFNATGKTGWYISSARLAFPHAHGTLVVSRPLRREVGKTVEIVRGVRLAEMFADDQTHFTAGAKERSPGKWKTSA